MKQKEYASFELADTGTRFLAALIDALIMGAISGVVFSILRNPGNLVSLILLVVYDWYFWTRYNGQTPGKMVMKIRVIKKDGTPMQDADAIIRAIVWHIGAACFGLGLLWAAWDENRQGWHDKVANTYVVKADSEIIA